jgi:hypothetical protein
MQASNGIDPCKAFLSFCGGSQINLDLRPRETASDSDGVMDALWTGHDSPARDMRRGIKKIRIWGWHSRSTPLCLVGMGPKKNINI